MKTRIATLTIQPERVQTFAPAIQRDFSAICQYIDWLFRRLGEPFEHWAHPGSDSWLPRKADADARVVVKALPWDGRMRALAGECGKDAGGVAVLVRDQYLEMEAMRVLWEEYGHIYHPCPPSPLFIVPMHKEKPFQLICLGLGGVCDPLRLPGVDALQAGQPIGQRPEGGLLVAASDEPGGSSVEADSLDGADAVVEGGNQVNRIVETLRGVLRRAARDAETHKSE